MKCNRCRLELEYCVCEGIAKLEDIMKRIATSLENINCSLENLAKIFEQKFVYELKTEIKNRN